MSRRSAGVPAAAATAVWRLAGLAERRRLLRCLRRPREVQVALLLETARRNAETAFGRRHGLGEIPAARDPVAMYRDRVPLVGFDELRPWVERIRRGEPEVLTAEPVVRLVPSSGSTAARKLVPYTAGLLAQYRRAIAAWMAEQALQYPGVLAGSAYWSISPQGDGPARPEDDPGPVPIGHDQDTGYLAGPWRRLVSRTLAVPEEVAAVDDVDELRRVTLAHLLGRRDLALVSVWHPSFLGLLLEALEARWDELVRAVAEGEPTGPAPWPADPGRARELAALDPGQPSRIWPGLVLVSCWADAAAQRPAEALARRLPGVALEPKGLIATEAFVTLPLGGQRPVALRSHVVELVDDHGRALLVDEAEPGREYAVAVTTAGGLYRYRLGDRVRVSSMLERTPCLELVGRDDGVSDQCGEKLNDAHVARVLAQVLAEAGLDPAFAMLAPDGDRECEGAAPGRWYTLYLEPPSPSPGRVVVDLLAAAIDEDLMDNPHYRTCRRLGQLGPVRCFLVAEGAHGAYLERLRGLGQRLGDIKPVALSRMDGWRRHLGQAG